jgi:alkylated DNA repair dioxygenase AlkB
MLDLFSEHRQDSSGFEKFIFEDGECWFMRDFLTPQEAVKMETYLLNAIAWRQDEVVVFGKKYLEPRKTAWHGDATCVYAYAGKLNRPEPWTGPLIQLKNKIQEVIQGVHFNSVLLNLYRDGNDKMGWHSDNEKELGEKPIIASLSLGAARYFDLKHKKIKTLKRRFELPSGSLFVMCGDLQENWLHQVPQQKKVSRSRINLTFREVFPLNEKS